jgi:hypothetical protein
MCQMKLYGDVEVEEEGLKSFDERKIWCTTGPKYCPAREGK